MIKKDLLLDIFETVNIQRWNDKLRPIDLAELDYQGHKMMIVYLLGKFEEQEHRIDWIRLIEWGIFGLLETAVLTDLRWDVKDALNKGKDRRERKNTLVLTTLEPLIESINPDLLKRFQIYLKSRDRSLLTKRILESASTFARWWEFQILWPANPSGYEIDQIKVGLERDNEGYSDLIGCREILCNKDNRDFIELCAQLRFQGRWSYLHIAPRVSVLGHSMFVAVVSYLFSLEAGACDELKVNNFFTGLFHDLEETQIRDVRGPLKKDLIGLREILQNMSQEKMEAKVLPLLPDDWWTQFKMFSMADLEKDFATVDGRQIEINDKDDFFKKYNLGKFNPRSGSLVKAADNLSALIEAHQAVENGCGHEVLKKINSDYPKKYDGVRLGSINLGDVYNQFLPVDKKSIHTL